MNTPDGKPNITELHQTIIEVKRKFPNESKVVIVPNAGSTYDTIIAVMDASRTLEATDTPLFMQNAKTGVNEQIKAQPQSQVEEIYLQDDVIELCSRLGLSEEETQYLQTALDQFAAIAAELKR